MSGGPASSFLGYGVTTETNKNKQNWNKQTEYIGKEKESKTMRVNNNGLKSKNPAAVNTTKSKQKSKATT